MEHMLGSVYGYVESGTISQTGFQRTLSRVICAVCAPSIDSAPSRGFARARYIILRTMRRYYKMCRVRSNCIISSAVRRYHQLHHTHTHTSARERLNDTVREQGAVDRCDPLDQKGCAKRKYQKIVCGQSLRECTQYWTGHCDMQLAIEFMRWEEYTDYLLGALYGGREPLARYIIEHMEGDIYDPNSESLQCMDRCARICRAMGHSVSCATFMSLMTHVDNELLWERCVGNYVDGILAIDDVKKFEDFKPQMDACAIQQKDICSAAIHSCANNICVSFDKATIHAAFTKYVSWSRDFTKLVPAILSILARFPSEWATLINGRNEEHYRAAVLEFFKDERVRAHVHAMMAAPDQNESIIKMIKEYLRHHDSQIPRYIIARDDFGAIVIHGL